MADPIDLEQFIEIGKVKEVALAYVGGLEKRQAERWDLLKEVILHASLGYLSMRDEAIEKGMRDQGAPLWLSCVLTVGMTLVPVTYFTGLFISRLTVATQSMLTRADKALLQSLPKPQYRGDLEQALNTLDKQLAIAKQIEENEDVAARYIKRWEPDLADLLVGTVRDLPVGKSQQPFIQSKSGTEFEQNAPVVVVMQRLHNGVRDRKKLEDSANDMSRNEIIDLYDIAVSKDPAKKAKERERERQEEAREKKVKVDVEKLPKTRKEALDRLKSLALPLPSAEPEPKQHEELFDLQLLIESMIWATTYDFTPRIIFVYGDPTNQFISKRVEAPLPDALWDELIKRYKDPDEEGKSYKEVGTIERVGTKKAPFLEAKNDPVLRKSRTEKGYGPRLRLSHYFSYHLFKDMTDANRKIIDKYAGLAPGGSRTVGHSHP